MDEDSRYRRHGLVHCLRFEHVPTRTLEVGTLKSIPIRPYKAVDGGLERGDCFAIAGFIGDVADNAIDKIWFTDRHASLSGGKQVSSERTSAARHVPNDPLQGDAGTVDGVLMD